MKRLLTFFVLTALLTGGWAAASYAETEKGGGAADQFDPPVEETYVFPVLKPEITTYGGYRYAHVTGDARVEEFEYLRNSLTFGGEARFFSFPHRFHLDIDYKNDKDYFGDLSYAYEDLILFRAVNRTLWHNLDTILLQGVLSPSAGVGVTDPGAVYGVRTGISTAFLRFKAPDFPLHVYFDAGLVERDGMQQLRSLMGSGYFNDIVRVSQRRSVDWHTKYLTIGANSHAGPLEVEISHGEKRFEAGGNNIFYDAYNAATSGSVVIKNAGLAPHNLAPDLKGSNNTLKIHSSHTGSLVASATFSKIDRDNRMSGASAEYFFGAGEVTWIASPSLALFFKYRHRDTDVDTPSSITFLDVCSPSGNASGTYGCFIKPALSSSSDRASATVRYRVAKGFFIRADLVYENIRRSNSEQWFVPDSTSRATLSLSADFRPAKNATLNVKYIHRSVSDPETNVEPDRSDEGRLSMTWVPLPGLTSLVSYRIAREKRDNLSFVAVDPATSTEGLIQSPDGRDALRHRAMASVSYLLMKNLSTTATYSYLYNRLTQDIMYNDLSGVPSFDRSVPQKDTAHSYALDATYFPRENITVNAGVSYTLSRGTFSPSDPSLLQPVSIASFSELKTRETAFAAGCEYRFKNGYAAGVRYRYSEFNDVLDNPYGDVHDGRAHIVFLMLTKRW